MFEYVSTKHKELDDLMTKDESFGILKCGETNNQSMQSHWLGHKQDNARQMVDVLQERLTSLNALISQRSFSVLPNYSFHIDNIESKHIKEDYLVERNLEDKNFEDREVDRCIHQTPHSLSFRNPKLPHTEAAKRIEVIIQKYQEDNVEDLKKKRRPISKTKRGINRLEVKLRERRKKKIKELQNQLENNSSKYLARAVNSVQFRLRRGDGSGDAIQSAGINADSKIPDYLNENFPIPLGGYDMNPQLLLRLSCEKMVINRGRQAIKSLALHRINHDMFIFMYWFIHCRFFQKYSCSEQRYLLARVAKVFPHLISAMSSIASPPKRDFVFRHYPFILSKAIYLGFRYLCPGNHNLLKGAFQRILYLSVFRLLTGVDICPGSVDALRLKIYPDDLNEDDLNDKDNDNQLRPMPERVGGGLRFRGLIHNNANKNSDDNSNKAHKFFSGKKKQLSTRKRNESKIMRTSHVSNEAANAPENQSRSAFRARNSVVKFMGDRDTLRYRADKPTSLGRNQLLRQQQVNFDANQISPLMQQCLGREGINLRSKQMLKRTEPVRYCRTGGVDTFKSKMGELEEYEQRREHLLEQHVEAIRDFKSNSADCIRVHQDMLKQIEKERIDILQGGSSKIGECAEKIFLGTKKPFQSKKAGNNYEVVK